MKKVIYILLIITTLISCIQKEDKIKSLEVISMNNTRPIDELKELVLSKGDTAAFNELEVAYLNEKNEEEYLLYSLVMANKYNYPRAYFQVYYCLTSVFDHSVGEIDEETKNTALKYLKKGVDLNDLESIKCLGELYLNGKYVKKDTILGKELSERSKKLCGY